MKTGFSKYKSTGLLSFTEVPIHWKKTRIKYIGFMYGGLTGKSGDDFRKEDDPNNKPFIPFTNICNNTYISKNDLKPVYISDGEIQNRVEKNDLFFLMSSETQEDVGKTSVLKDDLGELYLNSFCKGYRIIDDSVNPYFLNYLLYGNPYRQILSIEGNGFTRINLRQDRVNDLIVFIPPQHEQQEIVKYLDKKNIQIDNLISITERKIEILKQKRTSLINTVVTKGLNTNVELKNTGVEWIGKIPKHWVVTKIRRYCEVKDGTHDTPDYFDKSEKTYPLVTSNSFENGDIDFNKCKYISEKDFIEINRRSNVSYQDVIMSMIGSNIGNSVLVNTEIPFSIKNVCLFKTSESVKLNPKYLLYLIGSRLLKYQIDISQKGGGQPFLGLDELRSLLFPFPPPIEQGEIVKYLDNKTGEIDTLVSIEQRRIETLREYKQSLISEVVTGKIRVCKEDLSEKVNNPHLQLS